MGGPHSARLPELRHRDGLIGVGQHVLDLVAWRGRRRVADGRSIADRQGERVVATAQRKGLPALRRRGPMLDGEEQALSSRYHCSKRAPEMRAVVAENVSVRLVVYRGARAKDLRAARVRMRQIA